MGCSRQLGIDRNAAATYTSLVVNARAVLGHALAVRLHVTLLEVVGKLVEVLVVREEGLSLGTVKVIVPDTDESQKNGKVLLELGGPKVLVHLVSTSKQLAKVLKADADADGKTNGRPERVAATNPVPELEHVGLVNAKLGHTLGVGGKSDKVLGNRGLLYMMSICGPHR